MMWTNFQSGGAVEQQTFSKPSLSGVFIIHIRENRRDRNLLNCLISVENFLLNITFYVILQGNDVCIYDTKQHIWGIVKQSQCRHVERKPLKLKSLSLNFYTTMKRVNILANSTNKQISENEEEMMVFYCLALKNEEETRKRRGKK